MESPPPSKVSSIETDSRGSSVLSKYLKLIQKCKKATQLGSWPVSVGVELSAELQQIIPLLKCPKKQTKAQQYLAIFCSTNMVKSPSLSNRFKPDTPPMDETLDGLENDLEIGNERAFSPSSGASVQGEFGCTSKEKISVDSGEDASHVHREFGTDSDEKDPSNQSAHEERGEPENNIYTDCIGENRDEGGINTRTSKKPYGGSQSEQASDWSGEDIVSDGEYIGNFSSTLESESDYSMDESTTSDELSQVTSNANSSTSEYDFYMTREDFLKFKMGEETIHPIKGTMVEAKFNAPKGDIGDILSKYIKLKDGHSVQIKYKHINLENSKKVRAPRIQFLLYCAASNKRREGCLTSWTVTASRNQDFSSDISKPSLLWHVQRSGTCDHSNNITYFRNLAGSRRVELRRETEFRSATHFYEEKLQETFEDVEMTGDISSVYTPQTYRQTKHEQKYKDRQHIDWYTDAKSSKDDLVQRYKVKFPNKKKIPGVFYGISEHPANIIISSQGQIELGMDAKTFFVDSTGGVCRCVEGQDVLLTSIFIKVPVLNGCDGDGTITMPIIEILSNKTDAENMEKLFSKLGTFIKIMTTDTRRFDAEMFVFDQAFEFIYPLLPFNGYGEALKPGKENFLVYLELCHRIVNGKASDNEIKNFVKFHLCFWHVKKNVSEFLSKSKKSIEVKEFYMRVFYVKATAPTYNNYKLSFKYFCIVTLEEYENDDVKEAIAYFEDVDIPELDITLAEDENEISGSFDVNRQEEDDDNSNALRKNSPFYKDCLEIKNDYIKRKERLETEQKHKTNDMSTENEKKTKKNKYYNPRLFKYIINNKSWSCPMWSAFLIDTRTRYVENTDEPLTNTLSTSIIANSPSEYTFSALKSKEDFPKGHLPNITRAAKIIANRNLGRFLRIRLGRKFRRSKPLKRKKPTTKRNVSASKKTSKKTNSKRMKTDYIPKDDEAIAGWSKGRQKNKKLSQMKTEREARLFSFRHNSKGCKTGGTAPGNIPDRKSNDRGYEKQPEKDHPENVPMNSGNSKNPSNRESSNDINHKTDSEEFSMNGENIHERFADGEEVTNERKPKSDSPTPDEIKNNEDKSSTVIDENIVIVEDGPNPLEHTSIMIGSTEFLYPDSLNPLMRNSRRKFDDLTDTIVDSYLYLLCKHANQSLGTNKVGLVPTAFTGAFFNTILQDHSDDLSLNSSVVDFIDDYQLNSMDIWLFPIVSEHHFRLVILNKVKKEVMCLDSMGDFFRSLPNRNSRQTYSQVKSILRFFYTFLAPNEMLNLWNVKSYPVKFQNDSVSCGVYVCLWANILCTGIEEYDDQNDRICNLFRDTIYHHLNNYFQYRITENIKSDALLTISYTTTSLNYIKLKSIPDTVMPEYNELKKRIGRYPTEKRQSYIYKEVAELLRSYVLDGREEIFTFARDFV